MEFHPFTKLVIVISATVIIFVLVLSLSQFLVDWGRNLTEHSHQYADSKVTQLVENYNSYQAIETKIREHKGQTELIAQYRSQQAALKQMMCLAYNQLPNNVRSEKVPQYIQNFLISCQ